MRTGMIGSLAHTSSVGGPAQIQRHNSHGPCFCGRSHSHAKPLQFGSQASVAQNNAPQPQDPLATQQDTARFLGDLNGAFANSVAGRFFVNLGSNLVTGQSLPKALKGAVQRYKDMQETLNIGEQNEQVAHKSVEEIRNAIAEDTNKP